jgi:hypothetical protein
MYRYKVNAEPGTIVPGVGITDQDGFITSPIELEGAQFELVAGEDTRTDNKVVGTQVQQPNMVTDAVPVVNGEVI